MNALRFVSLFDMLHNFTPLFEIGQELGRLLEKAKLLCSGGNKSLYDNDATNFRGVVENIQRECDNFGFRHTGRLAASILNRFPPDTYPDLVQQLIVLNVALSGEMEEEGLVRIPYDRVNYFEQADLFGPEVAAAFPSCKRDIERAGSCYALEQGDGCVHHLMMVLERGLNALASKLSVPYLRTNWQVIIGKIESELKTMPRGPQKDFYLEVNAQFGFLKDAYRNHAEHARDNYYDIHKSISIYNHVRAFMQELQKGGLSE